MAERLYSIHNPDEPTVSLNYNYNYNLTQQRPQMYHNPHQQALFAGAATSQLSNMCSVREYEFAKQAPTSSWCNITLQPSNYSRLFAANGKSTTNNHNNGGNCTNIGGGGGGGVGVGVGGASMVSKINYSNNNLCSGAYIQSTGNGNSNGNGNVSVSGSGSTMFPSLGISAAGIIDDVALDGSFLTGGGALNYHHQYAPIPNSSSTYYNRNRYTPYAHASRHCSAAAAAATLPTYSTRMAAFMPNANCLNSNNNNNNNNSNNIIGNVYHQMSLPSIIGYNQRATNCGVSATSMLSTNNSTIAHPLEDITSKISDYEAKLALSSSMPAATTAKLNDTNNCASVSSVSNNDATTTTSTKSYNIVTSTALTTAANNTTTAVDNKALSAISTGAKDITQIVTLQITNLDYTMDESSLRNFLMGQLNPITPVISLVFEGSSYAKVTVPDLFFAKQVVSNLHRKKIGHKRMLVSYTRDSSLTEIKTLRCQVAGLLKDVPYYTLPMYKFRELFQSRFKTSISVLDLYKMPDICTINTDSNEEKVISLRPELIDSLDTSPLVEGLQHSVPYCTTHFKREQHKGWAEQEIEPLPNIRMTISELQKIIYPLLNSHPGDIPIASLLHCIEGQLNIQLAPNENGVNLEHLVCCIQGIQIQVNNFGIKILGWIEVDKSCKDKMSCSSSNSSSSSSSSSSCSSNSNSNSNATNIKHSNANSIAAASERGSAYAKHYVADSLYLISREVIELIKMSPKSTMKFNRFIPAYHNHFGKQCRVADYGYTKLIELFEALSTVVQIMGDGENRQITLTHRTQVRRFTSDLLRVLRAHGNKSVLLSQLPSIFTQAQCRSFDITDYGVCDIIDILDGLVHSNIVVVSTVQQGKDILISMPRRKQTAAELEKTSTFAGEMVELFSTAPQYAILFQKFVRSYHYHFAYQCRLSDYGFLKLADLMDAIQGIVELELNNDEDRKIFLSTRIAQRVFAEQCEELIRCSTGSSKTCMQFSEVLELHKKKYGYQILPQTLGVQRLEDAIELLPNVEVLEKESEYYIICHNEDALFRTLCYRIIKYLLYFNSTPPPPKISDVHNTSLNSIQNICAKTVKHLESEPADNISVDLFLQQFNKQYNENLTVQKLKAMRHFIEVQSEEDHPSQKYVRLSAFSQFLVSIVRCLEQRSNILLYDLKHALECHLSSTFEFGYPNLFSVLTAYPDLFAVNINIAQERSEVTLLNSCELRSSTHNKAKVNLSYCTRLPTSTSVNKLKSSMRATRPAFGDCNGRIPPTQDNNSKSLQQGPTPAKTRALVGHDSSVGCGTAYQATGNNVTYRYPVFTQASNTGRIHSYTTNAGKQIVSMSTEYQNMNTSIKAQFSSTVQHSNSFLNSTGSNKENSFDTSLSLLNASLNSSNCSLVDSNCSFDTTNMNSTNSTESQTTQHLIASSATKLWDRRRLSAYRQFHQQQLPLSSRSTSFNQETAQMRKADDIAKTLPMPITTDQLGIYEFINNVQKYPNYEPPKPDTPPAMNIPFWIDPIWSHNIQSEHQNHELLNIKLPEMKIFNVLPMLLSPYTLSKNENMKQMFNFENHDRKIA